MKLKGYSIWVRTKCGVRMFINKVPACCPYCKSTKELGCGGYVKLDF